VKRRYVLGVQTHDSIEIIMWKGIESMKVDRIFSGFLFCHVVVVPLNWTACHWTAVVFPADGGGKPRPKSWSTAPLASSISPRESVSADPGHVSLPGSHRVSL